MSRDVKIRLRHWVFIDDVKFFGPGRLELLEAIQTTGSIVKAAKTMEMSYKKAWAMVDAMNTLGKEPFVITQKGGQHGGGAELTGYGKKIIAAYKELDARLQKIAEAENDLLTLI